MNATRNFLIALIAVASVCAFAGWEDVGVSSKQPAARPAATQQAPRANNHSAPARQATRRASDPASGAYLLPPDLYSTFLDAHRSMPNRTGFTYVSAADADKTSEAFSELTLDGSFYLTEYQDVFSGDMTLTLDPAITFFPNDAGVDKLPSMLLKLAVDFDWIWRYVNGWSFEFGATPGIYADIDALGAEMFGLPFRGIFYYAFDPSISIKFGLECRPGWNQVIMPHIGLGWQPNDTFSLELALPRTLANINLGAVDLFGKIEWDNATYAMSGDKDEPDDFTINEWKLGCGLGFDLGDSWRLVLDGGLTFGRELVVSKGSKESSTDVDSAVYFGATLGWDL